MKFKDFRQGIDKLSDVEPEPSAYFFPDYEPYMQLHGLNQLIDVRRLNNCYEIWNTTLKTPKLKNGGIPRR